MKSLNAAAVVAGSLAVAGVATPASAAFDPSEVTPMSLNGAWNQLMKEPIDISPLKYQSDLLNTEREGSVLNGVKGATKALNDNGGPLRLLGGLPLNG